MKIAIYVLFVCVHTYYGCISVIYRSSNVIILCIHNDQSNVSISSTSQRKADTHQDSNKIYFYLCYSLQVAQLY